MRLSLEEAVGKGTLDVIDTFIADEVFGGGGARRRSLTDGSEPVASGS